MCIILYELTTFILVTIFNELYQYYGMSFAAIFKWTTSLMYKLLVIISNDKVFLHPDSSWRVIKFRRQTC